MYYLETLAIIIRFYIVRSFFVDYYNNSIYFDIRFEIIFSAVSVISLVNSNGYIIL